MPRPYFRYLLDGLDDDDAEFAETREIYYIMLGLVNRLYEMICGASTFTSTSTSSTSNDSSTCTAFPPLPRRPPTTLNLIVNSWVKVQTAIPPAFIVELESQKTRALALYAHFVCMEIVMKKCVWWGCAERKVLALLNLAREQESRRPSEKRGRAEEWFRWPRTVLSGYYGRDCCGGTAE